jgi:hypothetical protein
MVAMPRFFVFVVLFFVVTPFALAQVPPGLPYDAAQHANPIVTYVSNADFKATTYAEARDRADIELLGLSQNEGKRESIQIALTSLKKIRIAGRDIDVTLYPVVRQTFALTDGTPFVLHSFKFPKVPFPPQIAAQILNEAAFGKPRRPQDARFGAADPPEMMDIRGSEALLFDRDGELTVFWTEEGTVHTATAKVPEREMFRLVEDLL